GVAGDGPAQIQRPLALDKGAGQLGTEPPVRRNVRPGNTRHKGDTKETKGEWNRRGTRGRKGRRSRGCGVQEGHLNTVTPGTYLEAFVSSKAFAREHLHPDASLVEFFAMTSIDTIGF